MNIYANPVITCLGLAETRAKLDAIATALKVYDDQEHEIWTRLNMAAENQQLAALKARGDLTLDEMLFERNLAARLANGLRPDVRAGLDAKVSALRNCPERKRVEAERADLLEWFRAIAPKPTQPAPPPMPVRHELQWGARDELG